MARLRSLWILFVLLTVGWVVEAAPNSDSRVHTVSGSVTSEGQPVPFAAVAIEEMNLVTTCDIDGYFSISRIPEGKYTLRVSCLGYAPQTKEVEVRGDMHVAVLLAVSQVVLPEFEVMAERKSDDKIVIGEAAIGYTQPISLADVFLLLPGSVYEENSMSGFKQVTSRQVGSDANTSLGVAIMTDGAPISTDGMRSQMVGITENSTSSTSDSEVASRTGLNQGVDMRQISTDHIQSVSFTQGITSAKYGNLSNGMIQVNSKYGVSPLTARVKIDLKNKLFYVGKGFLLSEKAGSLHIGADYLHSAKDVREEMDKYQRITAQAYYKNNLSIGKYKLDIGLKVNQTFTVNKMKKDELTYEYDELYKANFTKTSAVLKTELQMGEAWMDKLEWMFSSDVTFDRIDRHKMVLSSSGPLSVPLGYDVGEHEGMYLPGKYYSDFHLDNIPVNFFTQLNASSRIQPTNVFGINLQYGAEFRSSKNKGEGAVIDDPTRPPFPYDNSYMRPRANWSIPALVTGAAYLQSDLLFKWQSGNMLKISLGGRLTHMYNLDESYALSNRYLPEPRVNMSYKWGRLFRNTIRVGYGEENKLPTLDYLYPDKIYKDFYMMNSYTNKADYRRLIVYTDIFNVENKEIKENKNRKFEFGWNGSIRKVDLSLTAFYEKTESGFEYALVYYPISYSLYSKLKDGVTVSDHIAQKEDYEEEQYRTFTSASRVKNGKKVEKKGLEYRFVFPTFPAIRTSLEVNGAYYKTNYGSSLPEYYNPGVKIADKPYPYIGIYDMDAQNEYHRLNTNLWLNTHIPHLRLIFTNYFQFVWFNTDQYKDSHNIYPSHYMDLDGNIHKVDAEIIRKIEDGDMYFRHLKQTKLPIKYEKNKKPVTFLWNFKVTKEFAHYAKLSFFVNGILDINPKYVSGGKTTEREWSDPYFGAELQFNFGR